MDAEKLPEALTPSPLAPPSASLTVSCLDQCVPVHCRPRCALEVVDELLVYSGGISGQDADDLLDLRQLLLTRREAETALVLFCRLRRRLEPSHYLAFYRLRRWLENHLVAEIHPNSHAQSVRVPLRLTGYCLEAVRRQCLCSALGQGLALSAPRLVFAFR